jgi:hypothetical protein
MMRCVTVSAVVILLVAMVSPNLVHAHLGDDGDAIEDAYGPLVRRHLLDDGTVTASFHKDRDPHVYVVLFDHGMSVSESISRVDGRELSEKEIANFLKANGARAKWTRLPENGDKTKRRFERSDRRVEATYGKMGGVPTLTVKALGEILKTETLTHK